MASYAKLIRQDMHIHNPRDTSSWPHPISELVRSIQNELKIPSWLKSGPVPYTNMRAIKLLDQLRASDDASNVDLWDDADRTVDEETKERLHAVFNTALVDCARIRAVVETENLTNTPHPKESFLVVLVRNAIFNAHPHLSVLEEVPVVFPRHPSGEAIPILKFMTKHFYAPLVVSVPQEMPVEEPVADPAGESSDEEEESSEESELFQDPGPTMSEFLDACERPKTPMEVEEEPEEIFLPPQFDAYFLAFRPSTSATTPSTCHVPVLCMADEEQLPVLMSTLLYQRRVWRISDPLIGLEFSKYDTTIRLFVGWLEDDLFPDRVLPRVHIGVMGTPIELDLSSPSGALVVARFVCTLESYMAAVHDSVRDSVGAVVSDTQSGSSRSWRIDTDGRMEDSVSDLGNNSKREVIMGWVKSQTSPDVEGEMPPHKKAGSTTHGSATSRQPSASPQLFYSPPPSSVTSKSTPGDQALRAPTDDDIPMFRSRLACSDFAATTDKTDYRVFRWMFDRRVVPRAIASDSTFCMQYDAMTGFVWPKEWLSRDKLPPVDAALTPFVDELFQSVDALLKEQSSRVKCLPADEFPFELRTLKESFSAIFQASRRSREKTTLSEPVYEAAWRHDHDRLLYDFFIRLVRRENTADQIQSIVDLEDPRSRPTLETTLRFPRSDHLKWDEEERLGIRDLMNDLLHLREAELHSWVKSRGGSRQDRNQEVDHNEFVIFQLNQWRKDTIDETEAESISGLGQFPSTGKCDALGRLVVDLPLSRRDLSRFPLVVRAAGTDSGDGGRSKVGSPATTARPRLGPEEQKDEPSTSNALTIPDSSGTPKTAKGTRYAMVSTAIATSVSPQVAGQKRAESVDALASRVEELQLGPSSLELPILAVEYKKACQSHVKGTNQLRMYLASSIKFLQAVGITDFAVYGVQTDGPVAVLPAAIHQDDFVHIFERLVERLDISTPLGAWHYATILCRLAEKAKELETKFGAVKESLVRSLRQEGNDMERWTVDHQREELKAQKRAKSPVKEKKEEKKKKAEEEKKKLTKESA